MWWHPRALGSQHSRLWGHQLTCDHVSTVLRTPHCNPLNPAGLSLSWLYILFCFLVKAFAARNSFGASLFSELVFYLLIFQNVSLSKIQRKHAFSMANGLLPEGTPKGRALEPKHICAKTYMPCTHLQEGCLPLVRYTAAKSYKAHEYG